MTPLALLAIFVVAVLAVLYWRYRPEPSDWYAGPLIRGKNYSPGVSLDKSVALWAFTLRPGAQVDGITKARGPLNNGIRLTYSITGTGLRPFETPDQAPTLSLYIARKGNGWSLKGDDAFRRWYSTASLPLTEGVHTVDVPFDPTLWHSVIGTGAKDVQPEFLASLGDTGRVGLGFGGWGGRMHGVITDTSFSFRLIDWHEY